MSNPTFPYRLIVIDPDKDAPRLMQDLDALVEWATTNVAHTHHIQAVRANLPALTAGTAGNVTGLTWPQAFPSGIAPFVYAQANDPAGPATGVAGIVFFPFNVSNTGCDVRCFNSGGTNSVALTNGLTVIAFDTAFTIDN